MSSDGSFGDFTREEYEKVEEQVIEELLIQQNRMLLKLLI